MDKVWCLLTGVMLLLLGRCSVDLPDPPAQDDDWMHGTQSAVFRPEAAPPMPEKVPYVFETVDPEEWRTGSAEVPGGFAFYCPVKEREGQNLGDWALTLGQIWTIFGEPADPEWYEDYFCYFVTAEDAQGHVYYFQLYQGSGGPSVCAPVQDTEEYAQAAQMLCAVICAAAPADYTWDPGRGESEDFDWAVRYSCRDGHALAEY